jgi:hypothetical protein
MLTTHFRAPRMGGEGGGGYSRHETHIPGAIRRARKHPAGARKRSQRENFEELCVDEAQCEGIALIFSHRLPSCVCSSSSSNENGKQERPCCTCALRLGTLRRPFLSLSSGLWRFSTGLTLIIFKKTLNKPLPVFLASVSKSLRRNPLLKYHKSD